jgi:SulP family sulfate permease
MPPEYGLYTAIVMTAVGALFDSSKQLINGPTNAISIAVLSRDRHLGRAEPDQAAILLAFLIGSVQLAITPSRLGDLTRYISHSVIVGFTAGASLLLVLDQLKNLLGLQGHGRRPRRTSSCASGTLTQGGEVHGPTLAVGLGSIAEWCCCAPSRSGAAGRCCRSSSSVVAAAAASAYFGFDDLGVKVVGEIPAKLPSFAWPPLDTPLVRSSDQRARDRHPRPPRGDRDGQGHRRPDPPEARHQPAVPLGRAREPRGLASSSACPARAR